MIIAWFSCGAISAVACKIALSLYDDGVKHGSNLLIRLNEGELTPDAFIKSVNGDRSF